MKKLIVICLVLVTGALSAQDNSGKRAAVKQTLEKKQANSSSTAKNDTPPTEPSAEPDVQQAPAPAPANRSIDEKGLSNKTENTGTRKQAVIQADPKNSGKTEEKKAQARPQQ